MRPPLGRRSLVVGALIAAAIAGSVLATRPWTWCPNDWSDATRIPLDSASGDVTLGGTSFRVGGSALLDYMPRGFVTPIDRLAYLVRGERHPLTVTATISADSREALGRPVFTCFRAIRGGEVWATRPTTYGVQTLADGYPPGAPPPQRNEAWRLAIANDGPEWPDGGSVSLEFWVEVGSGRYVFVVPPFTLMRGG